MVRCSAEDSMTDIEELTTGVFLTSSWMSCLCSRSVDVLISASCNYGCLGSAALVSAEVITHSTDSPGGYSLTFVVAALR